MRICLIVHEDRVDEAEVKEVVALASDRGVLMETRVATNEGDGSRLARAASAEKFDAVVAAGGDGALNAIVNGLAGTPTPLGIVPIGTANDFATQAGIPDAPREALDLILSSKPVVIDTASLNGRQFINVSSGGIGAETTAETPDDLKALLGPLAYAITGIRKLTQLEPMEIEVESPDKKLACEALIFAIGNGRSTGGGNLITPHASVTDGLLDVCIVEAMPVTSLLGLLPRIRTGEHVNDSGVHYFTTPEVTLRSSRSVSVNLDGEPMTESLLEYKAHRLNLNVYVAHLPGVE